MRVDRKSFDMILNRIWPYIGKRLAIFNRDPISADRQLALTPYRFGHVTSNVIEDFFGVSESLAEVVMVLKIQKLMLPPFNVLQYI